MKKQLLPFLCALLLSQPSLAGDQRDTSHPIQTIDYALILPGNLPHLLRTSLDRADKLGLDASQRNVLRELMAEAPLKVFSRLSQAEKLEQGIARDILEHGQTLNELQARLDELAAVKRAATEAQIATINRMQSLLSDQQFRQLQKLARANDHH